MRISISFRNGLRAALPIVLGYFPIALAYGVLARQAGLSASMTVLMSLLVFAGSAQFISVSMLAAGAPFIPIIITTFLVNLRHLLMSASLSPYFKNYSTRWLPLLAFGLTDETFAVSSTILQEEQKDEAYIFGLELAAYSSWVLGSLAGGVLGGVLAALTEWGLEFVLYAMYIFLLVIQLKSNKMVLVAVCSGILALLSAKFLPGHWYVILATILGASLGVILDDGRKILASLFGDGPGNLSA